LILARKATGQTSASYQVHGSRDMLERESALTPCSDAFKPAVTQVHAQGLVAVRAVAISAIRHVQPCADFCIGLGVVILSQQGTGGQHESAASCAPPSHNDFRSILRLDKVASILEIQL
jgi:hypothetical protein